MAGEWIAGEAGLLLYIQEFIRQDWLTPIMKFITHLGKAGIFWILLTLVFLLRKSTRRLGMVCMLALLIDVVVINAILKPLFARPRPYEQIDGLICIVKYQWDASFPSGHTAASFAAAGVFPWMKVKLRYTIPALILAALISLSRLYVGVHWPTDVLAGFVLGLVIAIAAYFLFVKCLEKLVPQKVWDFEVFREKKKDDAA